MSDKLIKQLREQRMSWLEVAPGKSVRLIRPPERDIFVNLYKGTSVLVGFDEMVRYTVGWKGFTEADVLGASIGSADEIPFSAELWAEVAADHVEWSQAAQQGLLDAVMAYLNKSAADTKN